MPHSGHQNWKLEIGNWKFRFKRIYQALEQTSY
jgi:hypothetical protein